MKNDPSPPLEILPHTSEIRIENPEGRIVGGMRVTTAGTLVEPDQVVPNFDGSIDLFVKLVIRVRRTGAHEARRVEVVAHPPGGGGEGHRGD